jgi:hypothetical protein
MTQEHFFSLMSRLEKAEGATKTTPYNPEKLIAEINSKMQKVNDLLKKAEKQS